ncbi:unnamed protein product [Pleuronectes platessa]|uniref:Uncharacterized protein n=1 Tax=Pleuronectes platessa TaxID=8262 RepID=A0A9N7Z2A0_PLEPL|nr:unnamed protein product [Pleuronectes platessa]
MGSFHKRTHVRTQTHPDRGSHGKPGSARRSVETRTPGRKVNTDPGESKVEPFHPPRSRGKRREGGRKRAAGEKMGSHTASLPQCSPPALRTSRPSPTVTRWLSVGACQGLCGFHKAVRRIPFPGALGAPAWPQRTVFMSCVIVDLSLSRRPASVKIAARSLRARPKSHHLPQWNRVSHNPLPDEAGGPQAY